MHRRWITLAILFAARAATGFQFQSVGSVADQLMRDLGLSYAQIGALLGAYLLPGIVVAFPAGLLGARLREQSLGLFGLVLMVISGLALANADSFAAALAARTVGGVGATLVVLAATKLTTDWFEGREIALAMSILQMSWPFGAMLALPIQAAIAQGFGWPAEMVCGSLCAFVALVAFALLPGPNAHGDPQPAAGAELGRPILVPVIVAGIVWGLMNLACVLFFSHAPALMALRGFSPTAAASLTSLSIWLTILAIPAGGFLVHRLGRPIAAIAVCAPLAAAALSSFVLDLDPTLACLIFGVAVGPLSGAILSLPAAILRPQDRSAGFGVFYTCFYFLMAVGPAFAGRLQDALASPSAALVVAAFSLVAIVPLSLGFAILSKPGRHAARRSAPGGEGDATVEAVVRT
ncbi:MFS transporter [Bradyrhizobium sp.]|uniref:MFS transporter n=1 Tax=Bradyrhizobium sp. TaxID=376 RepID=UPI001EBEF8F7|nr:MFS transporter [Bradyrhizobium sp.]MBV9985035.1 MFS transporter [Bradyrhizobium sp.]